MVTDCEHVDGDYMGKCAICENMVCGECVQTLFNTVICGAHENLEEESSWELLGFYSSPAALDERRYFLNEQGVTSIVVESEDDMTELYVPLEEKEDAYEVLRGASEEVLQCDNCRVFYSQEVGTCPICGVRQVGKEI
jgi:hypothetical protein